ncbi:protein kinase, partial [Proteus mirabilis]|uniref:protein kinase domain-containing protein n=1 Tax=Proteus mirabilis TaxID=584 RepID=UPI002578E393
EVGDIVHRDLKPGNILRHEERWKIADFGIAKFVEDSTSLETLREALTPSYAAPEQWLGQRPTSATDIYALGCIIHALV